MEKTNIKNKLENLKQLLRKAHLEQFFELAKSVIEVLIPEIPILKQLEENLILLESTFNFLESDILRGLVNYNDIERMRAKINSSSLKIIKQIDKEVDFCLQIQDEIKGQKRNLKFDVTLNRNYNTTNLEEIKKALKSNIENSIGDQIEEVYVKEGSIIIGFRMRYDYNLAKKLKGWSLKSDFPGLVEMKFQDPDIEGLIGRFRVFDLIDGHQEPFKKTGIKDLME